MPIKNFEEVVHKLKSFLPDYLREKGIDPTRNFSCIFPDHDDETPSCNVVGVGGHSPRVHCFSCLDENELLWTNHGLKKIKDISINDSVFGKEGLTPVVFTQTKESSDLWQIGVASFKRDPVVLTSDHTCLVVRKENAIKNLPYLYNSSRRDIGWQGQHRKKKQRSYKFKQDLALSELSASKVKVGDYVLFPIVDKREQTVLYNNDILRPYTSGPRSPRVTTLPANERCARLYGLYLAEGNTADRCVVWTFHINEKDTLAKEVVDILKKEFGLKSTIKLYKDHNTCKVFCSKKDLSIQLKYWFGHLSNGKRIPAEVLQWPVSLQRALLYGWIAGDGCKEGNSHKAVTVSRSLAYGMYALAVQAKMLPSLSYYPEYRDKNDILHQESWRLYFRIRHGTSLFSESLDGIEYLWCKVNQSEPLKGKRKVVDITTGDHTFCTKLGLVHNCGRTGDLFDIVQIMEDRPKGGIGWIEETLKHLAEKYNVELDVEELTEEQIYELATYRAYKAAAGLIQSTNLDSIKHKRFLEHIERRGWTSTILQSLQVGTVTSFADFRTTLKELGFTAQFLDEIDLGRKDIFNEENLIFTWRDEKGRPIGFTSRNLSYEEKKATAEENGQKFTEPKYNNQRTTGLKCNIFQKGRRLYGIDAALKTTPPLYLFEGQTDVITAHENGLTNCTALAGSSLNTDHIFLLRELGLYDLIIVLDSDDTGRQKTKQILEEKLAGHKDLRVRVIILPEEEDPDSFLRKNGLPAFKDLACWSAFEWRLNQYEEADDPVDICQQMVPFIVNEPSAIVREQQCKALSARTGVSQRAINEELSSILDEQSKIKSRERQTVLDRALYELQRNPIDAENILDKTRASLTELTKKHSADLLSCEDFVRLLDEQKEGEEKEEDNDVGFELGEDLRELREVLRGEWSKDVFMCIGGKSNAGKSSLLSKLAYSIATNNKDVCVIYHTIDDTLQQLVPRFTCIAEGSTELTQNMVRQPLYWEKERGLRFVKRARTKGYKAIRKLAQTGHLVVKDISHGSSLSFAESMISYYQERFPKRRIVYILDNVHKLRDFEGKDERVRFKAISEACKSLALRRRVAVLGSVEYTKLPPGTRPSNYNLAESVQFEYDSNFIAHLYNEVSEVPDSFTVFHKGKDWKGEGIFLPRVELIIGKNKITEQKTSIWLDFWPAASDFRYVSQAQVIEESRAAKESRKSSSKMELGFEEK